MNMVLKRLLWSVPTMIIIVLVGYILMVNAPGDPVKTIMNIPESEDPFLSNTPVIELQKRKWEEQLGLNLPLFYITIQSAAFPDTLYRITDKKEKSIIRQLCLASGKPEEVLQYRKLIYKFRSTLQKEHQSTHFPLSPQDHQEVVNNINNIQRSSDLSTNKKWLAQIQSHIKAPTYPQSHSVMLQLEKLLDQIRSSSSLATWVPRIQWHQKNRFHIWLFGDGIHSKGVIRGDFGISFTDQQPVGKTIRKNLFWSMLLAGISILMAYLVSIPIGIRSALHHDSFVDKMITVILFGLFSIPVFFMASLLQTFLANEHYLHIFEPSGIAPIRGNTSRTVWQQFIASIPYLILPIASYTYASFAFLSRLTKSGIIDEMQKPYIITAKAKGLSKYQIVYKHAFRNALIPLITIFAQVFPAMVGGSIIIEHIFNIPGMGKQMFTAYFSQNIPMMMGILTLTGIATIIGFLISDILYYVVDPRMRKA